MFSPEEQQIEICLLKSNLEKIGDDLLIQNSALPALDAQNEQKYRETMTALRAARSLNSERERLNLENVKLTAKRMQLKRQCGDITKALERARDNRALLTESLKREENEVEMLIRNYEDSLQAKAERFRNTSSFYGVMALQQRNHFGHEENIRDEEKMQSEIDKVNSTLIDLNEKFEYQKQTFDKLQKELESLKVSVPEDILNILGKTELDLNLRNIEENYKALSEQRNCLRTSFI